MSATMPGLITSRSPLPLGTTTLEMLSYIQQQGAATIVELERIAAVSGIETAGDLLFVVPPYHELNMVAWADTSSAFLACLQQLCFDVDPRPVPVLEYRPEGKSLTLPVGRADRTTPYVRLHWLPIAFFPKDTGEGAA